MSVRVSRVTTMSYITWYLVVGTIWSTHSPVLEFRVRGEISAGVLLGERR